MRQHMLTTTDNPWDYFTQFDEWNEHDRAKGHHTLSYLARVLGPSDDDETDDERSAAVEDAIDEIIENDDLGLYRKVESPEPADDLGDEEDEDEDEPAGEDDEDEDEMVGTADPQTRSRVLAMLAPAPDIIDADDVDEREWGEILAEMREAGIDLDADGELRAADLGDNELKRYWTVGKGLKRWRFSPHPWTKLKNLLTKHVGVARAKRMASEWFHLVFGYWPGSDLHRVGSGKPPRGKVIGPG